MNIFETLLSLAKSVPDLVKIVACPAALLLVGLLFAILHWKKAYVPAALALGAVGFFLMRAGGRYETEWLACYVLFAVLVSLLFLIPFPAGRHEKDRSDELYEKFHTPLEVPEDPEPQPAEGDAEECKLRLAHAKSLVGRLLQSDLSAGDRLEADAVAKTLDAYGEELDGSEARSLNDCLATVLKLTAKYKL